MKQLLAALSFFTRIPFWKLATLNTNHYKNLVVFWPMAGWITGTFMALTFAFFATFLPVTIAIIIAFIARLLLTGALHEDGFADFFDGFGGGREKGSILRIMKDSHIGTYGVIALIVYFLLLFNVINSYVLTKQTELINGCFTITDNSFYVNFRIALIFIAADPFAKWASSNVVNILPYARNEQQAKNKLLYNKMTWQQRVFSLFCGALPVILFLPLKYIIPMTATAIITMVLIFYINKKINGYTGDCCGALFIIAELTFYFLALIISL